jgi:hypothetical protein
VFECGRFTSDVGLGFAVFYRLADCFNSIADFKS